VAIDVGVTREFILLRPQWFNSLLPEAPLALNIKWKFAQPICWQPERAIKVWMMKRDYQILIGEVD
jgi:hypothetical protein